jgi:hypothetical protein
MLPVQKAPITHFGVLRNLAVRVTPGIQTLEEQRKILSPKLATILLPGTERPRRRK